MTYERQRTFHKSGTDDGAEMTPARLAEIRDKIRHLSTRELTPFSRAMLDALTELLADLETARNDTLDAARKEISSLQSREQSQDYNRGVFDALQKLWVVGDRAMRERND